MEDNKYYTPTKEEIYPELHLLHKDFVDKDGVTINPYLHRGENEVIDLSKTANFEEFRIKKLDGDDILDLDWRPEIVVDVFRNDGNDLVHGFSKTINETDSYCLIYTNGVLQIYLQHVYNLASGNWSQQIKFEGTIKNKSELRRLMKQLGINI